MTPEESARQLHRNNMNMLYMLGAMGVGFVGAAIMLDRVLTKQKPEQKSR